MFFNDLCPSSCVDYLLHLPLNYSLKSSIFGRSSWLSKLTRVATLNPLNATFKAYLLDGGPVKAAYVMPNTTFLLHTMGRTQEMLINYIRPGEMPPS